MDPNKAHSLFPIFRFFSYSHLPPHLQAISKPFYDLAALMIDTVQDDPLSWSEKETGLRKLLEAKDCFVRAAIPSQPKQEDPPKPSLEKPFPEVFYKILVANELGNDLSLILKFSDPDGIRTGKSGYSFGVSQFDLKNNSLSIQCLQECGFTQLEIQELVNQPSISDTHMIHYTSKLEQASEIVERYDHKHMSESLDHVGNLCNTLSGIHLQDMETFYHIADYHNQFHFTKDGKLHTHLKEQKGEITPTTILNFKLNKTEWGQKRPDDVMRRYNNIAAICRGKA